MTHFYSDSALTRTEVIDHITNTIEKALDSIPGNGDFRHAFDVEVCWPNDHNLVIEIGEIRITDERPPEDKINEMAFCHFVGIIKTDENNISDARVEVRCSADANYYMVLIYHELMDEVWRQRVSAEAGPFDRCIVAVEFASEYISNCGS